MFLGMQDFDFFQV